MTGTARREAVACDAAGGLARGTIGTGDLVFFVVAAAAPLTVMAGVAPLAIKLGGPAAPLGYLLTGAVLALFAAGFTAMGRHVRNAGAFSAYIGAGLGRVAGAGAAMVALLGYNLIEIGLLAAFAAFTRESLISVIGVAVPWTAIAAAGALLIAVLGWMRITMSAKVLGAALVLEVAVLLVFEAAVAVRGGGPAGLSAAPLDPRHLGVHEIGALTVISIAAFIGFEATAIYAEEARDPERTVPRATCIALAFLALFYALTVWFVVVAYGPADAVRIARTPGADDMVFAATAAYAGQWASQTMHLLIVTSAFAATLAFHNAATRYLFALGREGLLPAALGRTGRHGSPTNAVVVQTALAVPVLVAGFRADPYRQVFLWANGPGVIAIMAVQALTAVSVYRFFRTDRRGSSVLRVRVAPAAAALLLAVLTVLVVANAGSLTGAGTAATALLLATIPTAFIIGAGRALWMRHRNPDRYARLNTSDTT